MRTRGRALFSPAASAVLLLLPARARACACCAGAGDYYVSPGRPSEYELSVVRQIRFGRTARLYSTEAGPEESAKGLAHVAEDYLLGGEI